MNPNQKRAVAASTAANQITKSKCLWYYFRTSYYRKSTRVGLHTIRLFSR